MCTTLLRKTTMTITTNQTGYNYFPMTRWIPAAKVKEVAALFNILDRSSSTFVVKPAYQTANDPQTPDAWATYDADIVNPGLYTTNVDDISAGTDGKYFVRFGVGAKNASGGMQTGTVEMTVSARS